MTLQAVEPITVKFDGQPVHFRLGAVFTTTEAQARRILARAGGKVRVFTFPPVEPLEPLGVGWIITYVERGKLVGGPEDRQRATVQACSRTGSGWQVTLTNGRRLPLQDVRGVARTDDTGRLIAAWTVREMGYDGEGRRA